MNGRTEPGALARASAPRLSEKEPSGAGRNRPAPDLLPYHGHCLHSGTMALSVLRASRTPFPRCWAFGPTGETPGHRVRDAAKAAGLGDGYNGHSGRRRGAEVADLIAAYVRRDTPGQTARTRRMGREAAAVLTGTGAGRSLRRLSFRGHPRSCART